MELMLYEKGGDVFSLHILKVLPFFSLLEFVARWPRIITHNLEGFNFVLSNWCFFLNYVNLILVYYVRICLTCALKCSSRGGCMNI